MKIFVISPITTGYITEDKLYEATETKLPGCMSITDDDGDAITIKLTDCAHIRGLAWKVVTEEK